MLQFFKMFSGFCVPCISEAAIVFIGKFKFQGQTPGLLHEHVQHALSRPL